MITYTFYLLLRSVSLQKGTNQPDKTDESQWLAAWCRSTEYSTASKT